MKQFSFFIALFFTTLIAQAQVKISGVVKDNRGKKIISASITLKDTYDGATSDSAGNYVFTTTEKGSHILVASAVGYKTVEQTKLTHAKNLTILMLLMISPVRPRRRSAALINCLSNSDMQKPRNVSLMLSSR